MQPLSIQHSKLIHLINPQSLMAVVLRYLKRRLYNTQWGTIKRIYAKERDAIRRGGGKIGKVGEIIVGCNRSEQLALMCASEEAVVNKWRVCGSWFYVFCLAPDSRGSSDERLAVAPSLSWYLLCFYLLSESRCTSTWNIPQQIFQRDADRHATSMTGWKWILHFE